MDEESVSLEKKASRLFQATTGRDLRVVGLQGLLVLFFLGSLQTPAWARGDDWRPQLLAAEAGLRSPQGTLRIHIPPAVPEETRQRLLMELDGIDVTAMARAERDTLAFSPPRPLSWGAHVLRLLEVTADGDILERGAWTFEVRKTRRFREAESRLDADLLLSRRVAQKNLAYPPDPYQGQGSLQANGTVAEGDWRLEGGGDLYLVSEKTQAPNGKPFDLGEYLLSLAGDGAQLNLGHHDIGADNLILREFNRRGVSGKLAAAGGQAKLTAFAMRTESTIGAEDFLGIGKADALTSGATVTFSPFAGEADRLRLSAAYLTGKGRQAGFSEYGDDALEETSAWNAVLDARLLDRQLRLRGEYAASRANLDLTDPAAGAEDDYGYTLLADFTPAEARVVGGEPLAWNLGLEQRRVGTFFRSLGNTGLPSDKFLRRAFARLDWAGLSINASLGAENDNVNGIDFLPTTGTDQAMLSASYAPPYRAEAAGGPGLFGQPSFNAAISRTRQKTTRTPAGFSGTPADALATDLQLSAAFYPGAWSWSIGHILSLFEDRTDTFSDTQNNLTTLDLNIPLGERLSLTPTLQWNTLRDRDLGIRTNGLLVEVGAMYSLIADKLGGSINLSLNRESASDDSVDTRTSTLDASLNWALRPARMNRPGLLLFLSGNYQALADRPMAVDARYYQAFIGVRSTLPLAY